MKLSERFQQNTKEHEALLQECRPLFATFLNAHGVRYDDISVIGIEGEMIELRSEWRRDDYDHHSFPIAYLDLTPDGIAKAVQVGLELERAAKEAKERQKAEEAAIQREARERELYERLRQKYETKDSIGDGKAEK